MRATGFVSAPRRFVVAEYRIEFTIQRAKDGDDDFIDIGFGSSGRDA